MPRATRSASTNKATKPPSPPPKNTKRQKSPARNDSPKNAKPEKKVKKTSSNLSAESDKPAAKSEMKKMKMTGSVPVDPHFTRAGEGKVLEHNGVVYASTLNQSNIANNNNKFYILQIIEISKGLYYFYCRWGRVGVVGQTSEMMCGDTSLAIRAYEQKLREKTKSGSYRIVEMNYEDDENKDED